VVAVISFTHQREEWLGGLAFGASDRFEWSDVDLFVIHYPGGNELPTGDPTDGDFARHLRASHNDYLVNRGYSYGYNAVIDWRGESWEVRGEDFECAANKYVNGRSFAVQLVVDRKDPATQAQVDATNRMYAQACASAGRTLKILGHWQTTVKPYTSNTAPGTDCPGAGIFAQIQAGAFGMPKPTPPPTPPEEDDEVTEADKLQIIAGVVENIKSLDFVGRVVNYPVPVPGGGTADLWSLIVDSRARTMSAQAELAALRMDIAQLAGVGADQVTLEAINAKVDKLIKVVVGP
jgi:hypothetical protein